MPLPFEWPKRFLNTTEGEVTYFLFFLFGVAIIGPAWFRNSGAANPLKTGIIEAGSRTCVKERGWLMPIFYIGPFSAAK